MYKGRIGIWTLAIVISVIVSFLVTNVPKWFHTDDITVTVQCKDDMVLGDMLTQDNVNSFKFVTTESGGDVVIAGEDVTSLDGYDKIITMHSPLVLYFNSYIDDYNAGVIGVVSGIVYKMDLKTILTAMESGKEWADLGINGKVVSGKVNLCIPNESCGYYNDIVELFYFTLNDGHTLTDETRASLKARVDAIIEKCEKVVDIKQSIVDDCKKKDNSNRVYIGPEYLAIRHGGYIAIRGNRNSGLDHSYHPVYMNHHMFVRANLFVKTGDDGVGEDIVNLIKDKFTNKDDFVRTSGWRVQNETFDIRKVKSFLLSNPY